MYAKGRVETSAELRTLCMAFLALLGHFRISGTLYRLACFSLVIGDYVASFFL